MGRRLQVLGRQWGDSGYRMAVVGMLTRQSGGTGSRIVASNQTTGHGHYDQSLVTRHRYEYAHPSAKFSPSDVSGLPSSNFPVFRLLALT